MNILYISLDDPRKFGMGSQQRNNFLWRALREIGDVYTVFGAREKDSLVVDDNLKIRSIFLRPKTFLEAKFRWFFRGLIKYGNWPFRDKCIVRECIGWKDVKFDIVVARCLGAASWLSAWQIAPLYVDVDDVPTLAFESVIRFQLPHILVPVSRAIMRWWQNFVVGKCNGLWLVKASDSNELPKGVRYSLLHNIARLPADSYSINCEAEEKIMLTVGCMGYGPNSEGVSWFLKNVWCTFYEDHRDWKYVIVGRGADHLHLSEWQGYQGVNVMGYVDNLEDVYARASAVVAPINSGAGTCIKVIESAVYGKKTFATPFAVRGMQEDEISRYGIDVFYGADEFIREFNSWFDKETSARTDCLARIAADARKDYSFDGFRDAVRDMVQNG